MEELRLIIEAVSKLGIEGKDAFIWWLVIDKIVIGVFYLAGLSLVTWTISRIISAFSCSERIRDAMGVGTPGTVTRAEELEMHKWISERRNFKA